MGDRKGWLNDYLLNPESFIHAPHELIPHFPSLNEFLFRATMLTISELESFFLILYPNLCRA